MDIMMRLSRGLKVFKQVQAIFIDDIWFILQTVIYSSCTSAKISL